MNPVQIANALIKHFEGKSMEEIKAGTSGDAFVRLCKEITGKVPSAVGGLLTWTVIWQLFNGHFGIKLDD